MTPQEFEKIALWMGWDLREWPMRQDKVCRPNGKPLKDESGAVVGRSTKTSLTDAECVEALNRLVEKGARPVLTYTGPDCYGWTLSIAEAHDFNSEPSTDYWGCGPTIHEAVEQALLALIAVEGGKIYEKPNT